jgi:hypothetical protein
VFPALEPAYFNVQIEAAQVPALAQCDMPAARANVCFSGYSGLVVLTLSSSARDPGCVKTSSQVCVASPFAGAIDEAIH